MLIRWIKKVTPSLLQPYYNNKLLTAVEKKQTELVKYYLEKGANPNTRTKNQQKETALAVAVNGDSLKIIKLLLNRGADPNAKTNDEYGDTILTIAAAGDDPEIVKLLLERGANPNGRNRADGSTPLFYVDSNNKEIYKVLLKAGADPNITDYDSDTALRCACTFDDVEGIKLLLCAGADIHVKTEEHGTSLQWASKQGNKKVVQLLRETQRQQNVALFWLVFLQMVRNLGGRDREFSKELLEYISKILHKPSGAPLKQPAFKKIVDMNTKISTRISCEKKSIFQASPQQSMNDNSSEKNLQMSLKRFKHLQAK